MKKLDVTQMEEVQGGQPQPSCALVWAMTTFILIGGIAPVSYKDIIRCWNN